MRPGGTRETAASLRAGQANMRHRVDHVIPRPTDGDPFAVQDFDAHRFPLDQAPHGYEISQKKQDGVSKVLLRP
jgi:threonine dehydrogenase-like Zn-dependent dehydrogenase